MRKGAKDHHRYNSEDFHQLAVWHAVPQGKQVNGIHNKPFVSANVEILSVSKLHTNNDHNTMNRKELSLY